MEIESLKERDGEYHLKAYSDYSRRLNAAEKHKIKWFELVLPPKPLIL